LKFFSFFSGLPASDADYPNDYYNDEEYYSDDYDASMETNEIYDAHGHKEIEVRRNPIFVTQGRNIMVNEGDTIKLPCVLDKLDKNMVIMWKKADDIIALGTNIMGSDVVRNWFA